LRLFDVSPNEPVLIGLAAGSIVAFRATKVQPTQALRAE
jgi:ABC-type antimicrobial peptide transport system permease subunit